MVGKGLTYSSVLPNGCLHYNSSLKYVEVAMFVVQLFS